MFERKKNVENEIFVNLTVNPLFNCHDKNENKRINL